MSLYHELGRVLGELELAEERFNSSIEEAVRDASQLSVETLSADGSVKLKLNADCTVASVIIHRRKYEQHDADSLGAAVLSAYKNAVLKLGAAKRRRVMRTLTPDVEET